MKAMILREYCKPLVLEEVDVPLLEPGDLLIRVKACGVCASNVKYAEGAYPEVLKLPHILGHEPVGEVVDVGKGVKGFSIGDQVCIHVFVTCGKCIYCKKAEGNNCTAVKRIGMELPGGYAEFLRAPAGNCLKLPSGISFEEAATLADAAATSLHAIRKKAMVKIGDDVVLMGIGSLGIYGVQIARCAGARVIAVDISPSKLDFARKYGAHETIDASRENVSECIRMLTGGKGADTFIDYVGSAESVRTGLRSLRRGGRVVVVGHDPARSIEIKAFTDLIMEEAEIVGSHASTREELEDVIKLIRGGGMKPVVGAVFPLAKANEAHETLKTKEVFGRIVLAP